MPVVYLLDVYGELFFWPGWKPFDGDDPSTFDYELRTLEIGDTEISVFDPFEWPDTGSQFADGIMIYGAVLNRSMTDIYGQFSTISFGFE